jgi:polyisoprenoid-binding protein YceI
MHIKKRIPIKQLVMGLAAFVVVYANAALAADEYNIDPAHSSVEFAVKHMVISTVKGTFADVSGVIMYDAKDVTKSTVDVVIKAASVNTNNQKRDDHLRSPDFFDAAKYPDITFKSTKIEKSKDGLVMTGTLTIRGVSKEVSMPLQLTDTMTDPWGSVRFGAEAGLEINRQDYGVSWNNVMDNGGLVVSDNVKIAINVELVKEK